jgi:hypothetical protein
MKHEMKDKMRNEMKILANLPTFPWGKENG